MLHMKHTRFFSDHTIFPLGVVWPKQYPLLAWSVCHYPPPPLTFLYYSPMLVLYGVVKLTKYQRGLSNIFSTLSFVISLEYDMAVS